MTLEDFPPGLSIIAERHLARAKAALEELGIDTTGMPPAEIFDRAKGEPNQTSRPLKSEASVTEDDRPGRRAPARTGTRWNRAWRRDWRRRARSRSKIANGAPRRDRT